VGVYRLLLAALVVFFHFGGLSWIVGRVAVFAFYCVSGFLIFQVLDRVYVEEPRGIWRFYGNRLLRLGPLYVVYVVMTLAMVRWSGPEGPVRPETGRPILENMELGNAALLANALTLAPQPDVVGQMPVLEFIWIGLGLVAFLWGVWTAGLDVERFQSVVYKNTFTSVVVFLAGGAFYYLRRRHGQPMPFAVAGVLMLAWSAIVTMGILRRGEGPSARLFTEYVWLTVAVTGLVTMTRVVRLQRLDKMLGNLCYGVYLNHFLVGGLLVSLGVDRYFGRSGTLPFGVVVLAGSLALASVTFYLVERPFDRVRTRIRGVPAPASRPIDNPNRARLVVAVVTTALILLTRPTGFIAAHASQAGAGVLLSSPEFNVRWRASVTEADRLRIERELGLVEVGRVEADPRARTWTYRLRSPTIPGLRAVVAHADVEDTGGLEAHQFERLRD
jgi:peptidoglycan/LPS O-acetylase OafA/YrhL